MPKLYSRSPSFSSPPILFFIKLYLRPPINTNCSLSFELAFFFCCNSRPVQSEVILFVSVNIFLERTNLCTSFSKSSRTLISVSTLIAVSGEQAKCNKCIKHRDAVSSKVDGLDASSMVCNSSITSSSITSTSLAFSAASSSWVLRFKATLRSNASNKIPTFSTFVALGSITTGGDAGERVELESAPDLEKCERCNLETILFRRSKNPQRVKSFRFTTKIG